MTPSRLVLVRHGESEWNRTGRIQGQLDPPLSEPGLRQAEQVGAALARTPIDALHTSDLRRARDTAAAVTAACGIPAEPSALLREHHMGAWQGRTPGEIQPVHPDAWSAWTRRSCWDLVPQGEGAAPFEARVRAALAALAGDGGTTVWVTHAGVIGAVLDVVAARPVVEYGARPIGNCSLTFLEPDGDGLRAAVVDSTSHLDRKGARPACGSA